MSELWGGRRAPVTLLGGYLGSGKTTLLNELLASADRRYAVLVNDIGAVNVDAALVARRDGDTIELTDGCVCCSLVDGFALRPVPLSLLRPLVGTALATIRRRHADVFERLETLGDATFLIDPVDLPFGFLLRPGLQSPDLVPVRDEADVG